MIIAVLKCVLHIHETLLVLIHANDPEWKPTTNGIQSRNPLDLLEIK